MRSYHQAVAADTPDLPPDKGDASPAADVRFTRDDDLLKPWPASAKRPGLLLGQTEDVKDVFGVLNSRAFREAARVGPSSLERLLNTQDAALSKTLGLDQVSRHSRTADTLGWVRRQDESSFPGKSLAAALCAMSERTGKLREAFDSAARHAALMYPANLRGIEDLRLRDIQRVVMDDGIPLFGVPREETARALLGAATRSQRRAVLGQRWRGILEDCDTLLRSVDVPKLASERKYALEALEAVRIGHSASGQALAANLLDTLVTRHLVDERPVLKPSTTVKSADGYGAFVVSKYLALAPIWSAYQHFHPDAVPRHFGRHPSAHAVVPMQYSRRNAVQAVMLVASLVAYVNEDKPGARR